MPDTYQAILRDLVAAYNRDRGFPPQDVADLMGELRRIVGRAKTMLEVDDQLKRMQE